MEGSCICIASTSTCFTIIQALYNKMFTHNSTDRKTLLFWEGRPRTPRKMHFISSRASLSDSSYTKWIQKKNSNWDMVSSFFPFQFQTTLETLGIWTTDLPQICPHKYLPWTPMNRTGYGKMSSENGFMAKCFMVKSWYKHRAHKTINIQLYCKAIAISIYFYHIMIYKLQNQKPIAMDILRWGPKDPQEKPKSRVQHWAIQWLTRQ